MNCFVLLPAKAADGRCIVAGCRHRRGRRGNGRFCRRCRDRRYKGGNPLGYAYDKLRSNARGRGKVFALGRAEFVAAARAAGFTPNGRRPESWSVEREDAALGYTADNLAFIPYGENSRKGATVDKRGMCP